MQDFAQAVSYVAAIAGDPSTATLDFRAIHDSNNAVPAQTFRGTIADVWASLVQWNNAGYGIFAVVAQLDGQGRKLTNVVAIRAHYIDLDNLSAQQNYERAAAASPAPGFAVVTSPGRWHVYWPCEPYRDNDRFTIVQRKLRQVFDSDGKIIDATRVMRLPGTLNVKRPDAPHIVTCHALAGYGVQTTLQALEAALQGVTVIEGGAGERKPLGDPTLAAPSLEWLEYGLALVDPNSLDRAEWISITAAVKQAGWALADPETLFGVWSKWCAQYDKNDAGENLKQWNDITDTQVGWNSFVNRVPSLKARLHLDGQQRTVPTAATAGGGATPPMPVATVPTLDCSGEMLTDIEQREWFKGCVAIERLGEIMTPNGRFMNTGKFNVKYGGKQFIISSTGKVTDEAWKAATRSTLWTVPKVDHTRFLPDLPFGEIIPDQLGRSGVNTYIPINIISTPGDVSPFLRHMEAMLPVEADRAALYAYLAHNVKFPGYKIPWAPMIQSTEGVGKGFLMETMMQIIGEMYCYSPKAEQLVNSGSTFNAWMKSKLFIVVNEIRVDEKRNLIEILKPMISDPRVEVQAKGIDQEMEDNPANWLFFSNYKDAIPVNKNGRRYAIFYSAIQSSADLLARGMDDAYFTALFNWLHGGGSAIVAHWLLNYPIERGAIPMRAPNTSSMIEAVKLSRGPIERLIAEAVEDCLPGFRNGWVSTLAVTARMRLTGARSTSAQVIEGILAGMGYVGLGRAPRAYAHEGHDRAYLFNVNGAARVDEYGAAQGY